MFSFKTTIGKMESLKLHYIFISSSVFRSFNGAIHQRVLFSVNNSEFWHGGFVSLGNGDFYITLSANKMKSLGLKLYDEIEVQLKKDESEFGMPVPEELDEWLRQDSEAFARFNSLSAGKQRYIIYYISLVKSKQKRLERTELLMNNLKNLPEGKFDFRFLTGKS